MWEFFVGLGFIFLIIEIFAPSMFCLNFAISAFICAIISLFITNITILTVTFSILAIFLIFTLRPILMKNLNDKKLKTGIESKYVGKIAKAIENIDKSNGTISIYDERWQARNIEEGTIEKGSEVEIVSYESIVMYVKKINN